MANVKITELTELAAVDIATNDVLPIVDLGADSTKKVSIASLTTEIADPVEARRADNTFFVYNTTGGHTNVVITTANVEPSSHNTQSLGAPDKVWKEIYIGPGSINLGAVTIKPHSEEGIQIIGSSGESANIFTTAVGGVGNVAQQFIDVDSRLSTNATAFTNEDTALQSRLTTNVTAFTNEDTALQARITANANLLQDNVNTVSGNAAAVETRVDANLDIVSANATAIETRRVANIAGAISTVLTGDLTVSRALASDGSGKISVATTTLAELNHVNGVTSAIQTQLDAVEARRAANNITTTFTDDVIVTGNLTVNGTTTTINTTNLDVDDTMLMLSNGTTGSPSNDIGILFNRGNQGNAAFFYDESAKTFKLSDTKDPSSNTALSPVTAANLSVGIIDASGDLTVAGDGAFTGKQVDIDGNLIIGTNSSNTVTITGSIDLGALS